VFSDGHLFERVHGVLPSTLEREGARLLRMMKLEGVVRIEDGVFSTTDLSAGQRKRLALVVALLQDRPAYLLDEWAAEQDPGFRQTFYEEVLPALRAAGKTVVLVTHDDRWFDTADRIVHLAEGKVARVTRGRAAERSCVS